MNEHPIRLGYQHTGNLTAHLGVSRCGRLAGGQDKVFELIKENFYGRLKSTGRCIPGYPLLTKLLGSDPLTGRNNTTTAEKSEDFLILIEGIGEDEGKGTLQELPIG